MKTRIDVPHLRIVPAPREAPSPVPAVPPVSPSFCDDEDDDDPPPSGATLKWGPDFIEC